MEMDQHMETFDYLEGAGFSPLDVDKEHYRQLFEKTAKKVYKVITGRACPDSITVF
jgi:hypothetical protein